eukprot:m.422803 g.422803  ORF g.422803 m.422803 type:complete len:329 (-) comp16854_c0_seq1:1633-2619(-)
MFRMWGRTATGGSGVRWRGVVKAAAEVIHRHFRRGSGSARSPALFELQFKIPPVKSMRSATLADHCRGVGGAGGRSRFSGVREYRADVIPRHRLLGGSCSRDFCCTSFGSGGTSPRPRHQRKCEINMRDIQNSIGKGPQRPGRLEIAVAVNRSPRNTSPPIALGRPMPVFGCVLMPKRESAGCLLHRCRMRCLRRLRERSYFPPEPGSGTSEEPGVGPRGCSDTPPREEAGERRAAEPCPPDPDPDVGDSDVGDAIPPSGMECAQDVPFDAAHSCHGGCMPPTTTDAGPATQTDGLSVDVGAVDSTVLPCATSRPSSPVESEDGAVYM